MKNTFIQYLILLVAVVFFSIYLNGCMMAGMGIMHGGNMDMGSGYTKTVIKEYNTDNYVITAEFPSMVKSNSDVCKIKIFNKKLNSSQTDADIYLDVFRDNTNEYNDQSQNNFRYKINGSSIQDDYLIFSPRLASDSSYRLSFIINKIGTDIYDPPIEIQYQLENQSEMNMDHSHSGSHSIFISPYFYVGCAVMAVMIYVLR